MSAWALLEESVEFPWIAALCRFVDVSIMQIMTCSLLLLENWILSNSGSCRSQCEKQVYFPRAAVAHAAGAAVVDYEEVDIRLSRSRVCVCQMFVN